MSATSGRADAAGLFKTRSPVLLLGQSLFTHSVGGSTPSLRDAWLADGRGLAERAQQARSDGDGVACPEAVRTLLELAWAAIVTSGFDTTLERALRIPGRRLVTQIATPEFSASSSDPSLRLFRLFGTVDRDAVAELPPTDRRALLERRRVAVQMLGKLPELVGTGALAVAHWNPDDDWLRPSDLALALTPLARGQAHIFGIDDLQRASLLRDDTFSVLLDDGIVQTHPETLAVLVAELMRAGDLPSAARAAVEPDVVTVPVLKARSPADVAGVPTAADLALVAFDALEWREIEVGQVVFRDLDPSTPLPVEPQERYQLFRELLARGPGRHNVRYMRELAFRRPALDTLLRRCLEVARTAAPQEHLVLVRGQSGAGKSVILCELAVEIRRLGFPVAYVPPTTLRLDTSRLESFARRIAKSSEVPVFVMFDGLLDVSEYRDFAETFASRLAKCVIVGTSYTFQASDSRKATPSRTAHRPRESRSVRTTCVDVSVVLSEGESDALLEHLARFVPALPPVVRTLATAGTGHLFASLYRLLPEVRAPLEEQFLRECAAGAAFLERQLRDLATDTVDRGGRTLLEQKLRAALGARLDELRATTTSVSIGEHGAQMAAATAQLFNAVMLSTHLGQLMPQSLALRMLNTDHKLYRGAFTAGLLDEREVAPSVYGLSARSSLEAAIWIGRHLQDQAAQMEVVRQLSVQLDQRELLDDYCPELDFLVALLRAIGPQGRRETRLTSQYEQIAKLIADLRRRAGNISPRLSLQEANATREWVHLRQQGLEPASNSPALDAFLASLEVAEHGLRRTIDTLLEREDRKLRAGARRLLATLETERACVLGTMVGSLRRCLPRDQHVTQNIQSRANHFTKSASDAWRRALGLSDDNQAAVDAPCWILGERFRLGFLAEDERLDCLSDWAEMIDRYEALDLTEEQEDKRDERSTAFAEALGDANVLARIVERVRSRGSAAADHLIARGILAAGDAAGACAHLEKYCPAQLTSDRRVASLYLRAWWQHRTALPSFFHNQRMRLAFNRESWARLAELVAARLSFEPESATLLFLRAVALIHLTRVAEAAEILRDLDRLALGGSRRSKSLFLHADETGKPVPYVAVYQGKRNSNRLLVWCDALRQNVVFIPHEHGRQEPRAGSGVGPFHLAIEFRGLYADPVSRVNDQ